MPGQHWKQLRIKTKSDQIEILETQLLELGALSITYLDAGDQALLEPAPGETPLWDQCTLVALFDGTVDTQALDVHLSTIRPSLPVLYTFETLADQDWERTWLDDFKPLRFGDRLWVCPLEVEPSEPTAVNLRLDPGLAFGTGTHPTTALCLEWLDQHPPVGFSVLDFGCGSGILAIASLLLGANHATATDIDPQALQATHDNAKKNCVTDKITSIIPEALGHQTFDLLLANILAGPLKTLAETFAQYLKPGGSLVLSGILETQAHSLIEHYSHWFDMRPPVLKDEWVLLEGTKR